MNSGSEFESFISRANFELAWRRVRNSQKLEVKDRLSLKIFSATLDAQLALLMEDILSGNFVPSSVPYIFTPKKSGTLRPFPFIAMQDRLVFQAIGNIIIENANDDLKQLANSQVFSPVISDPKGDFPFNPAMSLGQRPGQFKLFADALDRARSNTEQFKYCVRADIAAFYPSIDHNLLLSCLARHGWLTDPRLLELLGTCLRTWARYQPEYLLQRGVPIGYETSDVLADLFLFEVDHDSRRFCNMLRYVDDMYLFTENHDQAIYALSRIDLALQTRGLHLQTSKLEIKENVELTDDNRSRAIFELQGLLSFIDFRIIEGNPELLQDAEEDMYKLIQDTLNPENFEELSDVLAEEQFEGDDAVIAFVFYRYKEKENWLKNAALYFLGKLPARSFHLTRYLSLFVNDEEVIDTLKAFVLNGKVFTQLRANCFRTLAQIWEEHEEIRAIARAWCNHENEWVLRITAIDILQNYPDEYSFLRALVETEPEMHARASALAACFQLTKDISLRNDLIQRGLTDSNFFLQALGVFLHLRDIKLSPDAMDQELSISTVGRQLLKNGLERKQEATATFERMLERLFGFSVNKQLPENEIFEDTIEISQLLTEAFYARETDANKFIAAISEFTRQLGLGLLRLASIRLVDLLPDELLHNISILSESFSSLPDRFTEASIFGSAKQSIKITAIPTLLEQLSTSYAVVFQQIHLSLGLTVPLSLQNKAQPFQPSAQSSSSNQHLTPILVEIFFSYAHKDDSFRKELAKHLAFLVNTTQVRLWSDRQIPPGNDWDNTIDEHLKTAHIVLFMVSADFIASTYIQKMEVPVAMQRHELADCKVIPVILRSAVWENEVYAKLQALPKDAKPIAKWKDPDDAYTNVAKGIQSKVKEILGL